MATSGNVVVDSIALDFQPNHKKENGHQGIVHPEVEISTQAEVAQRDRELRMLQSRVAVCPRRVSPYESRYRTGQQEQAARCFPYCKFLEGPDEL